MTTVGGGTTAATEPIGHWCLRFEGFDPDDEGRREALCTLANGYWSVRGAAPEADADGAHYPGTYVTGVYNRRTVKGSVKVWDAATKEAVSFDESVVRVKTPKSFLGGMFGQLAKGLAERIKNKPLAYESGLFSTQAAGNLPGAVK